MAPRKKNQAASWEVDADKPKPSGETRVRRNYAVKELTTQPIEGIDTIHDIIAYAARTHGTKNAMASRPLIKMINEEKEVTKTVGGKETKQTKKWSYFHMGGFEWINYVKLQERVKAVGSGLRSLGVGSEDETFFNIYGSTSLNWQLLAQACAFSAVKICTAYDSLGPEGLKHSLNEPSVRSMWTNAELLPMLIKVVSECPTVKLVVYDGKPEESLLDQLRNIRGEGQDQIKVISLDEVEDIGKKEPVEAIKADPEDVYCCMYTSGSTGTPKGVLLTHRNIVSAVGSVWILLNEYFVPEDTFLAFLPLAHIFEFVVEMSFIFAGLPIGYGKIKTLTDTNMRHCRGDIQEFKPSIMVGVPAVWELIRKGVVAKVEASGGAKKSVFNFALKAKQWATDYRVPLVAGLTDSIVFNNVKAQTGGRLRIVLNGGGGISKSTQEFLCNALVLTIQGYGLTETVGMSCILHPSWMQYGVVGGPVPSMEIKLVDAPEAGYLSTNKTPQGEIYVRGASLTKGYMNRPEQNAEAFTKDGWFKTGDVGQWNKDGTMSIIDRLKNLVKLAGGEYIAIEHLESIYRSCPLVANGAMIADPTHNQPMMIILPHPINMVQFAKSKGIKNTDDMESLVENSDLVDAVLAELNSVGKKAGCKGLELLEAVVLTADEWTPESGFLTAAQKLQRKTIEKHYEEQIKAVYK